MLKIYTLLILLFAVANIYATDLLDLQPVKVTTPQDGLLHWARAEVYQDEDPGFVREKILDVCKYQNAQLLKVFPSSLYQNNTADSSLMALFYGPGWDVATKTPVLLIPGAADDIWRGWTHPYSFETPVTIPEGQEGFMQRFAQAGYPVFAINFSHNQGCNYLQAEQIHNAIQIIKQQTGSPRVHLVAHSKGNCAASIYICGGCDVAPHNFDFLSAYKKDVDVYVQVGPANKGVDLNFRYYTANLTVIMDESPAPLCFYRGKVYGFWKDFYDWDIYSENPGDNIGNYFPGQNQVLYNLVDDGLDFSVYSYTPFDLNMTMYACYYGGKTLVVESYGINYAIAEGGNTIERLNERGLEPSTRLINIYGTNPVLMEIDLGFFKIPIGVPDHPNDGAIYVHSASYVAGLLSRGAHLLAQKAFDHNHVMLAAHPDVFDFINDKLQQ